MAKIFFWVIIIGAVAFGGYTLINKNNIDDEVQSDQIETSNIKEESSGKKMAFSSFIENDKGSYKCTVNQYMSDVESTGTVYIDAGKIRGDFRTIAEGKPVASSILIKDGYQYIWSSAMNTGIKMATQAVVPQNGTPGSISGTYSWSAEQVGDYDCDPWRADPATFSLPAGMTFTDFSAMIKP